MSKTAGSDSKNPLYCRFCSKSQQEVRKLIAGPTVFICDECCAGSEQSTRSNRQPVYRFGYAVKM